MNKRKLYFTIIDLVFVCIAFLIAAWIKPATKAQVLPNYWKYFLVFLVCWLLISWLSKKYDIKKTTGFVVALKPVFISNFFILAIIAIVLLLIHFSEYSRLIVFGTFIFAVTLEAVAVLFYVYNKKITLDADAIDKKIEFLSSQHVEEVEEEVKKPGIKYFPDDYPYGEINRKLVVEESGEKVYDFISGYIDLDQFNYAIFSTTTKFNIDKQPDNYYKYIINLRRINDIKRINKFFESVNKKLPVNGVFIGWVETKNLRKKRIFLKFPPVIRQVLYFVDFIYKRVIPKLLITRNIYFFLNRGVNRVISKQEAFGRLYSCGFEYIHDSVINGLLYFVFKKTTTPAFDFNPSYGPLFKMKRIGKDGKEIFVYKFRTMYPYSEYLQEYIYERNSLGVGGKFDRDFRVTTAGRFFRRFWLDELPMFINWFKGDLKLVGVRPLSRHFLSLYRDDLRVRRTQYKPGLVPPYYADLPKTLEEIMDSEERYLDSFEKHPFNTDIRYFFKAFYNIIIKKARSK